MKKMLDDVRRDAIGRSREAEEGTKLLVEAVSDIMELWNFVREAGLLALEEAVQDVEPDFLKRLILLLVNAPDSETMTEIATNEYWVRGSDGVQAMVDYMYIRGVIGIRNGESREILWEVLQSLVPSGKRIRLDEWKKESEKQYWEEVRETFSRTAPSHDNAKILKAVRDLTEILGKLSDRQIQRLVRDVDSDDLAVCVYGCDDRMRQRIRDNLSERYADVMMEKVVRRRSVSEEEMCESVSRVLSVIRELWERGEPAHEPDGEQRHNPFPGKSVSRTAPDT